MTRRVAHGNRARPGARLTGVAHDSPENSPPADPPLAGCGRVIGRSRYVVIIAVVAVLLVSLTLFLLGELNAFAVTGKAWNEALAHGEFAPTDLLIEILSVIDVMLRAVVFYIIGVGLYSLFIAPLNLTAALGVDSLIDPNGAASVWSHGIDLRGHDEIIAVETSNLVRPESDCHPTPFG